MRFTRALARLLIVLSLLCGAQSASAQVVFDAVGTAADGLTGQTSPFDNTSLTIGAGSNTALVAQVIWLGAAGTSAAVIWDPAGTNQSLTLIKSQSGVNGQTVQLWGRIAPTSGNKTLRVTWSSAGQELVTQGVSWTGVDQTGGVTTFPNSTSATGNTSSCTVAVTSATNNAVMAVCVAGTAQAISSVNNTQTLLVHGHGNLEAGGNRAAGAASVTMTGTYAGTDQWAIVGTDIKASGGATTPGCKNGLLLQGSGCDVSQ